jgi:hypothetical protein
MGPVGRGQPRGNPKVSATGYPIENEPNIYSDSITLSHRAAATHATVPDTRACAMHHLTLATQYHQPGPQHHHHVPPYHTANKPNLPRLTRNSSTPVLGKRAADTRTAAPNTRARVMRHIAPAAQHYHPVPPHHHPVPPYHQPIPHHQNEPCRTLPMPLLECTPPAGHPHPWRYGRGARARHHNARVQLGRGTRPFRQALAHAAHTAQTRAEHGRRGTRERTASAGPGVLQCVPAIRLSRHHVPKVPQVVDENVGLQPGRHRNMPEMLRGALPRLWRPSMAAPRLHLQSNAALLRHKWARVRNGRIGARSGVRHAMEESALHDGQSAHA